MKKNNSMFVIISIIIVIGIIFYTNGKLKNMAPTINGYDKLMLNDFDKNYPQSPSELISENSEIIKYLYSDNVLENEVEGLVVLQRKLFAKTLLDLNNQDAQIKALSAKVIVNKENKVKISDIEIYPPEYPEDKNNSICIIKAKHYMTKGGNIYRTYTVIKENDQYWKIFNWLDSLESFATVEELKK